MTGCIGVLIRKRLYAKCGAPPRHRDETPNNAGRRGTNGKRRETCREREIGVYWYLFSNGDGAQLRIYDSIEVDRDLSDVSC